MQLFVFGTIVVQQEVYFVVPCGVLRVSDYEVCIGMGGMRVDRWASGPSVPLTAGQSDGIVGPQSFMVRVNPELSRIELGAGWERHEDNKPYVILFSRR